MAEQRNQSLQIDFFLATDLVINNPIHFDALLTYYLNQIDEDNGIYHEAIMDFNLPLRKLQLGDKWFWDCSDSIIFEWKRSLDTLKKKFYVEAFQRKSVHIGGLKYCSRMDKFERIQTKFVRFFAYGNYDGIKELTDLMIGRNLGNLRGKGFGIIKNIRITHVDMQFCCWDNTQQILLRSLPIQGEPFDYLLSKEVTLKQGRYRPPYYDIVRADDDKVPLFCHGSKVYLSNIVQVIS